MNGNILTSDVIILCLFSGSRLGSPVTSGVTRRQSRVNFVDCKGIFTPPPPPNTSYLGTKKYPSFTKSRTWGGLKNTPSSAKSIFLSTNLSCIHTYIHIYIQTHIHTYVCTHIRIYTHTCIYKMCVCVCVCMWFRRKGDIVIDDKSQSNIFNKCLYLQNIKQENVQKCLIFIWQRFALVYQSHTLFL